MKLRKLLARLTAGALLPAALTAHAGVKLLNVSYDPTREPIVFLVRKGNPRQIKDWNDLIKPGDLLERLLRAVAPEPADGGAAGVWS